MGEASAGLLRFEVRRRVRTISALFLAVAAALTLLVLYAMPGGTAEAAGRAALETALVVLGVLAGAVAVGAAASAPADRRSGAASWLAATGTAAPSLRAAPAVAAARLAVAAAVAGGLVCVLLAAATGRTVPTERMQEALDRGSEGLNAPGRPAGTEGLTISLLGAGALELDVLPLWRTQAAVGRGTVVLEVSRDGGSHEPLEVAAPSTVRLDARGARTIDLRCRAPDAYVRVASARRVLAPATSAGTLLLASLLLGVALACGAPLAGLLARAMSAPTAMAAAALLLLVGAARDPLGALASDAATAPGGGPASLVLRAATAIAPDLSGLARVFEAVRGRALGLDDAASACAAPVAYGLALLLLLAFLPARRCAS